MFYLGFFRDVLNRINGPLLSYHYGYRLARTFPSEFYLAYAFPPDLNESRSKGIIWSSRCPPFRIQSQRLFSISQGIATYTAQSCDLPFSTCQGSSQKVRHGFIVDVTVRACESSVSVPCFSVLREPLQPTKEHLRSGTSWFWRVQWVVLESSGRRTGRISHSRSEELAIERTETVYK